MKTKKHVSARATRRELRIIEMVGETYNPDMYKSRYELRSELGQTELDQMCSRTSQVGAGRMPVYLRRIVGSLN